MRTFTFLRTARRVALTSVAAAVMVVAPLAAQDAKAPMFLGQAAPQSAPQGPAAKTLQISIDDAVTMALETSLGLKSERLNLDITAQGIAGAQAAFIPNLSGLFNGNTQQRQPTDFTQGNANISSHNLSGQAALDQNLPWYGERYHVSWGASRATQAGGIATFNPQLGSTLTFNFTQPLWRNLKVDSNRAGVETSTISRHEADTNLEQQIVGTTVSVRNAYLNLVAAIQGEEVAKQNMQIAEDSLRNAKARVAVGVGAQTDVIQATAQAASFQDQLIAATSQIGTMEDQLRRQILDPERPDYWTVKIEPTTQIVLQERAVDADAIIKNALANRLDAALVRQQMQVTDINLRVNENLNKPQLDAIAQYSAVGTGGTQFTYGSGFPPVELGRNDRTFGSALGDAFLGAYPSWTFGVQFGYPLGRSGAETAIAQQQLVKRQQQLGLHDLEIEIVREVREAVRQVQTSYERVQATQATVTATEQQLNAKQRQFEVGLSTTFEVQQAQRDLANAKLIDLQAKISYNRALISLDAVQKIRQ
ncbi:MAG TPA: TolC family protein [Vicinamibacterales bacterium]|nr:TolC family protein [Vicinamibacterales bacterium]